MEENEKILHNFLKKRIKKKEGERSIIYVDEKKKSFLKKGYTHKIKRIRAIL